MKSIMCFTSLLLTFASVTFSQSVMTFDAGTDIVVQAGADICADTVIINGTWSGGGTKCNSGPLPIQLASFTGTIVNNGVQLNWRTISEINNFGFFVQRTRQSDSLFTELPHSFIPGHGTTNEPQNYTYTDTTATPGQLSYRLKQMDLDGSIHYSDAVHVTVLTGVEGNSIPTVFALEQNYPNPFNPVTTLSFSISQSSFVTLTIYDPLGRVVTTLVNEERVPGTYNAPWDASGMASGVYFYRLHAGEFVQTRKLVLLR